MSNSKEPVFPQVCVVCRDLGIEPLVPLTMTDEQGRMDFYLYRIVRSSPDVGHSFLGIPAHHEPVTVFTGNGLYEKYRSLYYYLGIFSNLHDECGSSLILKGSNISALQYKELPFLIGPFDVLRELKKRFDFHPDLSQLKDLIIG
jgi:hypothetical protein